MSVPDFIKEAFEGRVSAEPIKGPHMYRWVFNPQDATVELNHNHDRPRHKTEYLTDMAAKHPHETVKGYAYRIKGGWRITDWEHKPLTDKYILKSVHTAIEKRES